MKGNALTGLGAIVVALLLTNWGYPVVVPSAAAEPSVTQGTLPLQRQVEAVPTELLLDSQLWGGATGKGDRAALLKAIDHSLQYLKTPAAAKAYAQYPVKEISRERVQQSLIRFRSLLQTVDSPAALQLAIQKEFVLYRAIGKDGQGTVSFTGYFEPTYQASRTPNDRFRYPLFRRPPDLDEWSKPHPTRLQLEGADGLQSQFGPLQGLELVWLSDRLEAFLVQVQGSARFRLIQGGEMTVGYAGRTNYPYTSPGREVVRDGKISPDNLTLPVLIAYFRLHPTELDTYLPRNRSFIFFRETNGAAPTGSLRVPVTPERTIATDKSLMPPGALALINTPLPFRNEAGEWEMRPVNRYVLDQDTGSAIKGAGRVDIFMGTGTEAGDRAGLINSSGQLYYLLLKN